MERKKICVKCGASLSEDVSFCPTCGSNQFMSTGAASGKKRCAKCGAEVDGSASFCSSCGSNQFVSGSGGAQASRFKTCKRCGARTDLAAAFCAQCGYDQFISVRSSDAPRMPNGAGNPTPPSGGGQAAPGRPSAKKKEKKKLKWWMIVLIVLGILAVAGLGEIAEKRAQAAVLQQTSKNNSAVSSFSVSPTTNKDTNANVSGGDSQISSSSDSGSNSGSSSGDVSLEEPPEQPPVITAPEYEEPESNVDPQPEPVTTSDYGLYEPIIRAGQDSAFGDDFLRVIVPIMNTSSENKYLRDISVTVCDANGAVIKEITANAYPNVIAPGSVAFYIGQSRTVTLTDAFPYTVTNIERNMGSGDFVVTANVEPVNYAITASEGAISEEYGPLYSYTVTNDSSETAEKGSVVSSIVLYDENALVLDVLINGVNAALAPGESKSYEKLYQNCRDYEAAEEQTFEVVAYKQYATNGQ